MHKNRDDLSNEKNGIEKVEKAKFHRIDCNRSNDNILPCG